MLAAEAYSRDLPRVFVSYDALLTDWRTQAARIEIAHGRALPGLNDTDARAIDAFLTPELRHHQAKMDLGTSEVGALAASLLDWLMAAARDAAPSHAAMDAAALALKAMQDRFGALVSPLTRDLDQSRADLLYTRQLLDLERADLRAQIEALKANAR